MKISIMVIKMIKTFDKKIETLQDMMNFIEYMKYLVMTLPDGHPIRIYNKCMVTDLVMENAKVLRGEPIES
jgi:hypothetical protein